MPGSAVERRRGSGVANRDVVYHRRIRHVDQRGRTYDRRADAPRRTVAAVAQVERPFDRLAGVDDAGGLASERASREVGLRGGRDRQPREQNRRHCRRRDDAVDSDGMFARDAAQKAKAQSRTRWSARANLAEDERGSLARGAIDPLESRFRRHIEANA